MLSLRQYRGGSVQFMGLKLELLLNQQERGLLVATRLNKQPSKKKNSKLIEFKSVLYRLLCPCSALKGEMFSILEAVKPFLNEEEIAFCKELIEHNEAIIAIELICVKFEDEELEMPISLYNAIQDITDAIPLTYKLSEYNIKTCQQ